MSAPPFLEAAWGRPVDRTPVWFMRQAGRYLPEYRAIREHRTLLEICADPALATEVTLQPVRRLEVDAAILFADILLPLVPMGLELDFVAGEGPVIGRPVRSEREVAALRPVEVDGALAPTLETIRLLRAALPGRVPLIGFVGGPFTVATYGIEGGPSRHLAEAKRMMHGAPAVWHALMSRLTTVLGDFLVAQVRAGAQAVQVFDSWAGQLSVAEYREFAFPYTQAVLARVEGTKVPRIHFAVGADHLLPAIRELPCEVVGFDWRTSIAEGWRLIGEGRAVQGNLDPALLTAPRDVIHRKARAILDEVGGRAGHIFNLGHGVLPDAPVDEVRALVDLVHSVEARR